MDNIVWHIWFGILLLISFAFFFVWVQFLRPYIKKYGENPGSIWLKTAPIVDYRKAKKIAENQGYTPWFIVFAKLLQIAWWIMVVGFFFTIFLLAIYVRK